MKRKYITAKLRVAAMLEDKYRLDIDYRQIAATQKNNYF
jgi:hypothetical protein